MNQGIKTIIYPVNDLAQAKAFYKTLLGAEPFVDSPYYVAFMVGDQQIGLARSGPDQGATGFYHVDDIRETLQSLLQAGATLAQDVKDVGGGKLNAMVKDSSGNTIGLIQMPT